MTRRIYRPRRRLRNELFSLVAIGALIFSLVSIFPLKALQRPLRTSAAASFPASCAFITLTPAQESALLTSARASWAVNANGTRDLRLEMLATPLLEDKQAELLNIRGKTAACGNSAAASYDPTLVPPTCAAPAPAQLAPAADDATDGVPTPPAFPREDLLKLN